MKLFRPLFLFAALSLFATVSAFAQATGSVSGTVTDPNGAVVVGASVTVLSPTGLRKDATTNAKGEYNVTGLAPGKYTVKVFATKFELYENTEVEIKANEKNDLQVVLIVGGIVENVEVGGKEGVSTDVDKNADATVLGEKEIQELPDDPDELQSYLQALAGASAGPNGGQIYIDGFTGGQLPSKESIREIRINSNPFSAEYDRPGFGRIEILTKPGSDKFRGSVNGSFNDESLNSRNPFALNRAPTQQKRFGGNVSGPIKKGKSSYFVDIQNNWVDNNTIINAQLLDPSLNIIGFRQDVQVPTKNFRLSPRFDIALNDKNTLVTRYSFNKFTAENQGLSETSLPTRAYESSNREHELRLTETMIINAKTVNETRFEYSDNLRQQTGDNSVPGINVASAFISGGASIGNSYNKSKIFDLNNFTSTSFGPNGQHSVKFGGRLRRVSIEDRSENGYAGTFNFQGFTLRPATAATSTAPAAPADTISEAARVLCGFDTSVTDPQRSTSVTISSVEQYRCRLRGATDARFNPSQYNVTAGNPLADITQTEGALFVSDDWKVRPSLLLSFGVRYENQNNIDSNFNFAPRFGFAYSPGANGARSPKTVIRGGAGIFYDRFSENTSLQALRYNGLNQLSILVSANDTDPLRAAAARTLLAQPTFTAAGTVTNVPTVAQILTALPQANTTRVISPTLQAPYSMQYVVSVERQLTSKYTLTTAFVQNRNLHQIRQRNINAPVCISITNCTGAVRPDPTRTNITAFESAGVSNSTRLNLSLRANLSRRYSFNANYSLGFVKDNISSPAYAYDLTDEYGRSSGDVRHSFVAFGNFNLPWSVNASMIVSLSSGRPFNITRGIDVNGDGLFNERPTFQQLADACTQYNLRADFCNISGFDPTAIIPRNYGIAPSIFTTTLRLNKNFGFGTTAAARAARNGGGAGGQRGGGNQGGGQGMMMGGMGGGMMRGPGGGGFGGDVRHPYNLNVGISVSNLFNTVNLGAPVGQINSFRFGQSISSITGGFGGFGPGGFGGGSGGPNRRVELNMRFSW